MWRVDLPLGESLDGFLMYGRHRLLHELAKSLRRQHAVIARMRNIDIKNFFWPARPGGHNHHPVAQKNSLFKIVGNEENRDAIFVEHFKQRLARGRGEGRPDRPEQPRLRPRRPRLLPPFALEPIV